MGRWLEIYCSSGVICDMYPGPIVYAAPYMPKSIRVNFPYLSSISINSGTYIDEEQTLSPSEVEKLLGEFQFLRKVCSKQVFIKGFNVDTFLQHWQDKGHPLEFEEELNRVEKYLTIAVEGHCHLKFYL